MFRRKPKAATKATPSHHLRDIAVAGRTMTLTVRENPRARRMTLRIDPGATGLSLSVPTGMSDREIERFLLRHHHWLSDRLKELPKPRHVADGSVIPVRDRPCRIMRTGKLRDTSRIAVHDSEDVLLVGGSPEHLGRRVRDFLKREARADLEAAVARHSSALGRRVSSIRIKDTRSRWGSCSSNGSLSFSWRIVMAPEFVLDYLAAHEVAHLAEMNHGPGFWKTCRSLCERTDDAKGWLKRHGSGLHAIKF